MGHCGSANGVRRNESDDRREAAAVTPAKRVPTNLRCLLIIEALADAARPLTPAELGERVGLPKATAHRLCAMLVEEGLLIRDSVARGLRPARRARRLGSGLLGSSLTHIARHKILEEVSRRTEETCNLVAAADKGMVYLDRVDTPWPLRFQLPVGTHVPFHCTASGKLFLSSLSERDLNALLNVLPLSREGPNTLTDPALLRQELARIRAAGHSVDNEEFMAGMVAIGAPILDAQGRFYAAITIHAPRQRLTLENPAGHIRTLKKGAAGLRKLLFQEA